MELQRESEHRTATRPLISTAIGPTDCATYSHASHPASGHPSIRLWMVNASTQQNFEGENLSDWGNRECFETIHSAGHQEPNLAFATPPPWPLLPTSLIVSRIGPITRLLVKSVMEENDQVPAVRLSRPALDAESLAITHVHVKRIY